jgi:hypothetical protein
LRAGRVSGANLRLAVKKSVELVKINSVSDIPRNDLVNFAKLSNAIDEKHGAHITLYGHSWSASEITASG